MSYEEKIQQKEKELKRKLTKRTVEFRGGNKVVRALNEAITSRVTQDKKRSDVIKEVAEASGVAPKTIYNTLCGSIKTPPKDRLKKYADALGINHAAMV